MPHAQTHSPDIIGKHHPIIISLPPTATAAAAEKREKEKKRGARVGAANLPWRTRGEGEKKNDQSVFLGRAAATQEPTAPSD
jgi:hypothetical protein